MKKKNGFTLIELLAVIVILAIIALIATPIILNLIEKARKGAAQDSANGVRKAAQLYYSSNLIDNFDGNDIIFECNGSECVSNKKDSDGKFIKLDIDGTIPTNGKIEIKSDGKMIFSNIIINGYSCEIPENGNSVCTKSTIESTDDSAIALGEIEVTVNSIVIPYTLNGETSSDVALNNSFSNSESVLLAYNDQEFETKEMLLLNDNGANVTCEYGTSESYGESGILQNNSCYITGLDANTTYYYKLTVTDSNGDVHTKKGNVGTSAYVPGEVIYYNPFAGENCYDYNFYNSLTGYNGDNGNSDNNYQNACLKWYIITTDDDNSKNTIDVILDHNTTPLVTWNMNTTDNSAGMAHVSWKLIDDTALWNGVLGVRLITADEIANITGASSENTIKWSSTKSIKVIDDQNADINVNLDSEMSWFYFDGKGSTYNKSANGWQLATATQPSASKYAWLYDNLRDCMDNGCNMEDNKEYDYEEYEGSGSRQMQGYWTSTPIIGDSENAWGVKYIGNLARGKIYEAYLGVRPVITISKDSLKVKKTSSDDYVPEFEGPSINLNSEISTTNQIVIDFNVNSDFEINKIICEYGTDNNYGNVGVVENNICTISELKPNTEYFYRIVVIDRFSMSEVLTGSVTTDIINNSIENKTYISGEALQLGGYNWHVISDDGTNVTLLMDAGQLDDNNNMDSCEIYDDTTYLCSEPYSWEKSAIRKYFLNSLYPELSSKINNMVTTEICADPSNSDWTFTYGGYLVSEMNEIYDSYCEKTVNDYIRLATDSEYWNLNPNNSGEDYSYPNPNGIVRLSIDSDYNTWLYSNSIGDWWLMTASRTGANDQLFVLSNGDSAISTGDYGVRPVITIQKQ